MRRVLAKLRRLPTWAKIAVAAVLVAAAGAVAYLVLGPAAGGATVAGGIVAAWGALFRSEPAGTEDIAQAYRRQKERDAATARDEAEAAARHRAAIRAVEAERRARAAAAGDDGDPARVLQRHRRRPGDR